MNRLLKRWQGEYLVSLRRWRCNSRTGKSPSVGDIVLVREGPRRLWPLARVVEVMEGSDGNQRVAVISLRGSLTRRALSLLYPLEAEPPWSGPILRASSDPQPASVDPSPDPVSQSPVDQPTQVTSRGRQIRLPARFRD